jgi:hypothetical protein
MVGSRHREGRDEARHCEEQRDEARHCEEQHDEARHCEGRDEARHCEERRDEARHCEERRDEAIQQSCGGVRPGLLRCARNDGGEARTRSRDAHRDGDARIAMTDAAAPPPAVSVRQWAARRPHPTP